MAIFPWIGVGLQLLGLLKSWGAEKKASSRAEAADAQTQKLIDEYIKDIEERRPYTRYALDQLSQAVGKRPGFMNTWGVDWAPPYQPFDREKYKNPLGGNTPDIKGGPIVGPGPPPPGPGRTRPRRTGRGGLSFGPPGY